MNWVNALFKDRRIMAKIWVILVYGERIGDFEWVKSKK